MCSQTIQIKVVSEQLKLVKKIWRDLIAALKAASRHQRDQNGATDYRTPQDVILLDALDALSALENTAEGIQPSSRVEKARRTKKKAPGIFTYGLDDLHRAGLDVFPGDNSYEATMARIEALRVTGGLEDITTATTLSHTIEDADGRWMSTNVSTWSSLIAALTNIRPGDRVYSISRRERERAARVPEYQRLSARGALEGLWTAGTGAAFLEDEVEDGVMEVQAEGAAKYIAKPPVLKRIFAGLAK